MSPTPFIIGIAGEAGVGKDTAAAFICEATGYERYALSSPIKRLLNARFGWNDDNWESRAWKEGANAGGFSPREWAQWLGTDVGRETFGERCWVKLMEAAYYAARVGLVVPDVRFQNEVDEIVQLGGRVLLLRRKAASPLRGDSRYHPSEAGVARLTGIDETLDNDKSITELRGSLYWLLKKWNVPCRM